MIAQPPPDLDEVLRLQHAVARAEQHRRQAERERDEARTERDAACGERDAARFELARLKTQREVFRALARLLDEQDATGAAGVWS